jgi:hypothetical protein
MPFKLTTIGWVTKARTGLLTIFLQLAKPVWEGILLRRAG